MTHIHMVYISMACLLTKLNAFLFIFSNMFGCQARNLKKTKNILNKSNLISLGLYQMFLKYIFVYIVHHSPVTKTSCALSWNFAKNKVLQFWHCSSLLKIFSSVMAGKSEGTQVCFPGYVQFKMYKHQVIICCYYVHSVPELVYWK